MTQQELDALQGLCEAATAGPWHTEDVGEPPKRRWVVDAQYRCVAGGTAGGIGPRAFDADFIAAARTALPALIAEVRRMQAANDDLMSSGKAVCADNGRWAERHLALQVKYDALENDLINANMNLGIMTERCEAAEAENALMVGELRAGGCATCAHFACDVSKHPCKGCRHNSAWERRTPQPTKEVNPDA